MQDFFNISLGSLIADHAEAFVVTDAGGVVLYQNAAAESLFAQPLTEGVPNQWQNIFSPQTYPRFLDSLNLLAEGCVVAEQMYSLRVKEGNRRYLVGNYPFQQVGSVAQIMWYFRPLVEEHTVTDVAMQANRYKTLFDVSIAPQWVLAIEPAYHMMLATGIRCQADLKRRLDSDEPFIEHFRQCITLIEVNQSALKYMGAASSDKVLALASFPDRYLSYCAAAVVAMIEGMKEYRFEVGGEGADGKVYCCNVIAALPETGDLDRGILFTGFDSGKLKEIQRDIEHRERFLSATLTAVPDLLFVYDYHGAKVRFINQLAREHFGVVEADCEHLEDRDSEHYLHFDDHLDRDELVDFLKRLSSGEVVEKEVRLRHISGEWRRYATRTSGIVNHLGRTTYSVTIATDITERQKIKDKLDDQQRNYRLLAENFSDIICTTDTRLRINYISPSVEKTLGFPASEFIDKQRQMAVQFPALALIMRQLADDFFGLVGDEFQPLEEQREYLRLHELEVEHCLGHKVSLELQSSLMWEDDGRLQGLLIICRDITQRLKAEDDRRLSAKVFDNSLQGIYITAADGTISQVNKVFTEITGYSAEEAIGCRPSFLSGSRQAKVSFGRTIAPILQKNGFWQGELDSKRKNGKVFPAQIGVTSVCGKHGEHIGYITSFSDVTESKRSEERIRKLAFYDSLTGLANRSLFQEKLQSRLQLAQQNELLQPLLFIDMDGFKAINDSLGHGAGDLLLSQVGQRLQMSMDERSDAARMGGDEFTVTLGQCDNHDEAVALSKRTAQSLLAILSAPFFVQGKEVFLSASIGVAIYPSDGCDSMTLLQNADAAMYHAKAAGKNNYQYYAGLMNSASLDKLELQNDLHRAVAAGDFELYYQPVVDLSTRRVVSVEALVRWFHPQRGNIRPEVFVPLAEEAGLIVGVGNWVLNEACMQMAEWRREGVALQRIAVNISALQFSEGGLLRHIINALESSGLPSHCLGLEITESLLMEDVSYTLGMLADLKAMDVNVSIDDFGTGYSSMSYLKQFPIDHLKIDRSFIANVLDSEQDKAITTAIIAMAKSFDLSVIAEGVESEQQALYLEELGCDSCQGYLYGKPMSAEDISRLLEDSAPLDRQLQKVIRGE
ncbi:bifunctional diguanylate cyclase/phosphodiesterase [Sinobacterium caligoides]|nr:bifunctional diguanylate cyclase/phosphodiesterase [Sinobacterium caligoides]